MHVKTTKSHLLASRIGEIEIAEGFASHTTTKIGLLRASLVRLERSRKSCRKWNHGQLTLT